MDTGAIGGSASKREAPFPTPVEERYWEDYILGVVHSIGSVEVEEAEMIAFARRFDPQPFHTDPEAAEKSAFGGLIASGWYTASCVMRILVDHYISHVASLGSPGVDQIRWLKPVRAGDTLFVRATVIETKRSRSKPEQGFIRALVEVLNRHEEVVMTMKSVGFVGCRERP